MIFVYLKFNKYTLNYLEIMFNILKKIISISDIKYKNFLSMFILFNGLAIIELINIACIGPYIALILGDNKIYMALKDIFFQLGLKNPENVIIYVSIFIIIIFFFSSLLRIFINIFVTAFSENNRINVQIKLIQKYINLNYLEFVTKNRSSFFYNITDLTSIYQSLIKVFLKLFSDLLVLSLILIFLAIQNIQIFLYLSVIVSLFILIFFKFTKNKAIYVGKSIDEETNAQFKLINESFDGFSELRISNIADKYFYYIKGRALSIAKFKIIREVLGSLPRDFFQFIAVFIIASLILIYSSLDKDINEIL